MLARHSESADVMVIAAWHGRSGFCARITYAESGTAGERRSQLAADPDLVLELVARWLRRVERRGED